LFTLSANYGEERNVMSRPDLGRKFYGGRVAVALTPAPKWALAAGLSYQEGKFDAADVLLGVVRKDKYVGLDAILSYALTRTWSVRGEYQYTKNDSNLALYEFDRHLVAVKLRYEFK
jgi:predicted porin